MEASPSSTFRTMRPPITYDRSFLATEAQQLLECLQAELAWVRCDAPRSEYYINAAGLPYTYGQGVGRRTYQPQPEHPAIYRIRERVERAIGVRFEVCFLNRYHNQSDHLGWHADNSPEMDDARPIAIVSFGVAREIWFRSAPSQQERKRDHTTDVVTAQTLHSGSLCVMAAGMQDTHQHRIPKASFLCGERISLTFRGYVPPPAE